MQGFFDFFRGNIGHVLKNFEDTVKPDIGPFFNIGVGWPAAAHAGMPGSGADRPAAAPSGGAQAQVTLIDQADIRQDFTLLETDQVFLAACP